MLNIFARPSVSRALQPVGRGLARAGATPDAITLIGTVGSVAAALVMYPQGWFFVGTVVITVFVLFDMLDGALARARGTSSKFGAVLDSTCDRLVDAAIFGSLAWWFAGRDDRLMLLGVLVALVSSSLTSYVKARAEGVGLSCDVGIIERPERLILILVGVGLSGLGIPYVLPVLLWVLVALSVVTVGQRVVEVRRQARSAVVAAS